MLCGQTHLFLRTHLVSAPCSHIACCVILEQHALRAIMQCGDVPNHLEGLSIHPPNNEALGTRLEALVKVWGINAFDWSSPDVMDQNGPYSSHSCSYYITL